MCVLVVLSVETRIQPCVSLICEFKGASWHELLRSSSSHLYRAVSEESWCTLGRQTHGTRHDDRGDAYARASHAFPSWAYENILDGEAERGRNKWQTSLVFGGGRRSFTLVHMWRRIPKRRSVKCERTLLSSILQIAESIIRALTHTDGGSGPNGNRRNSGAGRYTEFSKYFCNDFSTNITLSNIVNIY